MPHRMHAVVLTALGLSLIAAGDAAGTERFAKPGGTSAADCLTEATACALGKAIKDTPSVASPDANTVTVLPGAYTPTDLTVGDPASFGELVLKRGSIVRGQPGGPAPTFTNASADNRDVAAKVTQATLQHFVIRRTGAPQATAVRVVGVPAEFGNPALPGTLDRVTVESDTNTFGVYAESVARIANTLVDQKGGSLGGALVTVSVPGGGTTRIVNSSLFSAGAALQVSYGNFTSPSQVDLVNSLLFGTPDIAFGTSSPSPTSSVTVATTTSGYRPPATTPAGQFVTGTPVAFEDALISDVGAPLGGSTLIDAGSADPLIGSLDLAGKPRVQGAAIDIGAYEFGVTPTPTPTPTATPVPVATPTPTPAVVVGPGLLPLPTPVPDTKAPALTSSSSTKTLKRSKLAGRTGLDLTATVDEAATVGVELILKTTKKGKTTEKVLGSATAKAAAAGPAMLKLKIKASKLGKGSLKATVRFTATDLAGNKTVVERKTTVK